MIIKTKDLENKVLQTLKKKYDDSSAQMIADVILFGEYSGKKSHGIVRLVSGGESVLAQEAQGDPEIIIKTKLSRIIEGNNNPGMLVASIAMQEAVKIAKEFGFSIIGTRGTNSTSGCLSYYIEKIANQNLIGIVMARSPQGIAPFNSSEALFGTNPIAWAIPSKPVPLLFDMGTSAISWGALLKAEATKQEIPRDVAIDKNGNPTTDPKEAMDGAVLGFDNSYKSSGLSMMVEILSGVLPGAGFIDIDNENGWGNMFIVFQPDLLMDIESFKNKMQQFVDRVKNSKSKDRKPVRITGESTLANRNAALKSGEVEVADELIGILETYL
jgi:LDH2 family malate/lactate/ureidoglycolate dehydrogenase